MFVKLKYYWFVESRCRVSERVERETEEMKSNSLSEHTGVDARKAVQRNFIVNLVWWRFLFVVSWVHVLTTLDLQQYGWLNESWLLIFVAWFSFLFPSKWQWGKCLKMVLFVWVSSWDSQMVLWSFMKTHQMIILPSEPHLCLTDDLRFVEYLAMIIAIYWWCSAWGSLWASQFITLILLLKNQLLKICKSDHTLWAILVYHVL